MGGCMQDTVWKPRGRGVVVCHFTHSSRLSPEPPILPPVGDFRSQVLSIGEEGQHQQQQQRRQLLNTNAPYSDVYVARFDKDGKLDWATSWGGEGVGRSYVHVCMLCLIWDRTPTKAHFTAYTHARAWTQDDVASDIVWDASTNALYVFGSFKSLTNTNDAFPEAGGARAQQGLFDGFADAVADWADDDGGEEAALARKRARKGRQLAGNRRERIVTRDLGVENMAAVLAGPWNVFALKVDARDGAVAWANPLGRGEGVSLTGLAATRDGTQFLYAAIQYLSENTLAASTTAMTSTTGGDDLDDALPLTPFGSVFDPTEKDDGVADYEVSRAERGRVLMVCPFVQSFDGFIKILFTC